MRIKISTEGVELRGRIKPRDIEQAVTFSAALFAAKMGVLIEHNKNMAGALGALRDLGNIERGGGS